MFSGSEREEVAFENLNCPVRLLAAGPLYVVVPSAVGIARRVKGFSVGSGEKQREGKDGANRLQVEVCFDYSFASGLCRRVAGRSMGGK